MSLSLCVEASYNNYDLNRYVMERELNGWVCLNIYTEVATPNGAGQSTVMFIAIMAKETASEKREA